MNIEVQKEDLFGLGCASEDSKTGGTCISFSYEHDDISLDLIFLREILKCWGPYKIVDQGDYGEDWDDIELVCFTDLPYEDYDKLHRYTYPEFKGNIYIYDNLDRKEPSTHEYREAPKGSYTLYKVPNGKDPELLFTSGEYKDLEVIGHIVSKDGLWTSDTKYFLKNNPKNLLQVKDFTGHKDLMKVSEKSGLVFTPKETGDVGYLLIED